jgi:transposase InsO family protein
MSCSAIATGTFFLLAICAGQPKANNILEAAERPRFGYRRLYVFLRREKAEDGTLRWRVNHKRVYRLYREEGLTMQRRRRKRFRAEARVPLALPTRANEVWSWTKNGGAGHSPLCCPVSSVSLLESLVYFYHSSFPVED